MTNVEIPPFQPEIIEGVARVLGDTTNGLTGSQISQRLREVPISDIDPSNTKWKRLYNALAEAQNEHTTGKYLVGLIHTVMKPVRFNDDPAGFT